MAQGRTDARREIVALAAVSAAMAVVRLYASGRVGFGDSEALYASYALHPQPAYLDHPGLVGLAMRAIGGGTAPTPEAAHVVTAIGSSLAPWARALAGRAAGAGGPRAGRGRWGCYGPRDRDRPLRDDAR